MSLTIFHVTNNHTPYCGGVVHSINTCVEEQRARGYNAHIVTFAFAQSPPHEPTYIHRIGIPLPISYKQNDLILPWRSYHHIEALVKKLRPNIIHIHHPFLLGSTAVRVAHTHNIPVIFTYHSIYRAYAHYVPAPRWLVQYITDRQVKRVCSQVNHIICPSPTIQQLLLSQGITTPISVVPSAVDAALLYTTCPSRTPMNTRMGKLLIVARFVEEKNLFVTLDIMHTLPHRYELTLVGYGYLEQELREYVQEQNIHNVQFVIQPTPEILATLYKTHDLFLFTSHVDTQAIVLAEAMAAGMPVLALDGPGQRAIVINNYNGFLEKDMDTLSQRTNQIYQDPALFKHLSENAWLTSQKYKAQTIVDRLDSIYKAQIL